MAIFSEQDLQMQIGAKASVRGCNWRTTILTQPHRCSPSQRLGSMVVVESDWWFYWFWWKWVVVGLGLSVWMWGLWVVAVVEEAWVGFGFWVIVVSGGSYGGWSGLGSFLVLGCWSGLLIGLLRLWLIGSRGFDGCRWFGWSVKKNI